MSTRGSSRRQKKKQEHVEALAALEAARKGTARVDQMKDEVTQAEDVYQLVTQDEYEQLVEQRRQEGDFVIDDGTSGYADDGEEGWDGPNAKNKKISKVAMAARQQTKKVVQKPLKKISNLFLGAGGIGSSYVGPDQAGQGEEGGDDADGFLDNLLDDLDANPLEDGEEENTKKKGTTASSLKDMAIFGGQDDLENVDYAGLAAEEAEALNLREEDDGSNMAVSDPFLASVADAQMDMDHDLGADHDFDDDADMHVMEGQRRSNKRKPKEEPDTGAAPSPSKQQKQQQNGTEVKSEPGMPSPPQQQPVKKQGVDWMSVSRTVTGNDDKENMSIVPDANQMMGGGKKVQPLSKNNQLRFFWYDAFEDSRLAPGQVFLFGKALMPDGKTTESCCVVVKNLERNIFVLPRKFMLEDATNPESATDQEVGMQDVYKEMKHVLNKCGVKQFRAKPVTRKYCFDRDANSSDDSLADPNNGVPTEAQYLKVKYSATQRTVPRDLTGKSFSHIFGTRSSSMELFLLKRKLVGPCWVTIKDVKQVQANKTWCKHEYTIDNQKSLTRLSNAPPAPKFTCLSLSLKTVYNKDNHRQEVVMASLMFHNGVSIEGATTNPNDLRYLTIVRPAEQGGKLPFDLKQHIKLNKLKVQQVTSERALLNLLMARLQSFDPDVLVGHGLHETGLDLLITRMRINKIMSWSKLGRLKKVNIPSASKGGFSVLDQGVCAGRLVCDTEVSAKELIREKTYTLTYLADVKLNVKREEVDHNNAHMYMDTTPNVLKLVSLNENDAYLTLSLMHKLLVLPLTNQLTSLCGNLWNRSLRSKRAERVEYLLLHEFHKLKYISPEKYTSREKKEKEARANGEVYDPKAAKKKSRRRKPAYEGGLVLEPKRGFYDKFVLLLDFNSLYPSIIREFNICFTTVSHWDVQPGEFAPVPEAGSQNGLLPKVIKRLLERRGAVKKLLKTEKNPEQKVSLDIRQKALKLVANSMYGCLGFPSSRFYCQPLAALITSQGRDILQRTCELSDNLGHPVIYGDTDSIMVYTNSSNYKEVMRIGKTIKEAVNKMHHILEIEIDGVYKNMLLLRKKKYAAQSITALPNGELTAVKEVKGLDLVRRDWSLLSKDVGNYVLSQVLRDPPKDLPIDQHREALVEAIHERLRKLGTDMREGKVPLEQYVITKGLTKAPKDYPDAKGQPHVVVALQRLKNGHRINVGDHIPYVICEGQGDGSKKSTAARAHHPEEVRKSGGKLKPDVKWYLTHQILPPTARLCDPIEETSKSQLAECLGLDGRAFAGESRSGGLDEEEDDFLLAQDDEERFKQCVRLPKLQCPQCKVGFDLDGVYRFTRQDANGPITGACSGLQCVSPGCKGTVATKDQEFAVGMQLINSLNEATRKAVGKYYQGWTRCNDSSCGRRTRDVSVRGSQCLKHRCNGTMVTEYPASALYTQLQYFSSLFDVTRAERNIAQLNQQRKKDSELQPLDPKLPEAHKNVLMQLRSYVHEHFLAKSRWHHVYLPDLFNASLRAPSRR